MISEKRMSCESQATKTDDDDFVPTASRPDPNYKIVQGDLNPNSLSP